MTDRERAASRGADTAARLTGGRSAPARPDAPPSAPSHRTPAWEELYQTISDGHQRELLSLAERQGVLYAHQLPAASNGVDNDPQRRRFARLLAGTITEFRPLHPPPIAVRDPALDQVQREAVAKALATPDLVLLQGRAGSGKSRVVAEIIHQAASRGERVLLVAPTPAALDRVLERLAGSDVVLPVRCIDRDEDTAALPLAVRALTFAERLQTLSTQALAQARRQAEADEQLAGRLEQQEPLWTQAEDLARQAEKLQESGQALEKERAQLAEQVTREAASDAGSPPAGVGALVADLVQAHRAARQQQEARLAELRSRNEAAQEIQADLDAELHTLEPLVEAKHQGRWWTPAWWQATVSRQRPLAQWTQQQEQRQQVAAELESLERQIATLTEEGEEAERQFTAKKARLIAAELARRQADLDGQQAALRRELDVVQQKWQTLCQGLAAEDVHLTALTTEAVASARAQQLQRRQHLEQQRAFTQQWRTFLQQTPGALADRLSTSVNLVAATLRSLPRDERFGDASNGTPGPVPFDLLILEEADQATETEFLQVARRARRCVLLAEPSGATEPASVPLALTGSARDTRSAMSGLRARISALSRSGVFGKLWQHLHCDPRQLPYAWTQEKNRLCCRLRPVAAEQRQWISTEHVADFPDIELRILTVPCCQPVLAEIAFPPSFTLERAKQYIFQELEELPVQASASSLRWVDEPQRLILRLADRDLAHGPAVDLVSGIREILGAAAPQTNDGRAPTPNWQTCCLEFDTTAGWNLPRAQAWVQQHLGLHDLGRTVRLDVCYRMEPKLASFVTGLLSGGAAADATATCFRIQASGRNGWSAPVEFVPVPALSDAPESAARGSAAGQRKSKVLPAGPRPLTLPSRGGAGLELDLADARHRERLPAELRAELPAQGWVNYAEAQAVVRTIACLAKEKRIAAPDGDPDRGSTQAAVAVIALYPAQAELIRRLLERDSETAAFAPQVEVGIPAAFRQREAAIVLLSLTRSHTHRAVAYGDGPHMLALAVTRPRTQLLIFGDPGTLIRRSQWEGPLEHLSEEAAAREHQLITRLVHCLQGTASSVQAAPRYQGSGT